MTRSSIDPPEISAEEKNKRGRVALPPGQLPCVTRRSLTPDGLMLIEVIVGNFRCSRTFNMVDAIGELVRRPRRPLTHLPGYEDYVKIDTAKKIQAYTALMAATEDQDENKL